MLKRYIPLVDAVAIRAGFSDIATELMSVMWVFQSLWVWLNTARLSVVVLIAAMYLPSADNAILLYCSVVSKVCVGVISCCA